MEDFEMQDKDYSNKKVDLKVWKEIIKIIFTKKKNIILMIISAIGLALLDICYPLLNTYAIEHFFDIPDPTIISDESILKFMLCYIAVAFGYGIFVFSFLKMASVVEVEVGYVIRKKAFDKLQYLPFSYYDKTPSGWIMSRMTSDARRLSGFVSWSLVDLLWSFLLMVAIMIVLYVINWKLALIMTCIVPILLFISFFIQKKILKSYRGVRKINSNITAKYNEGILGSKTTKTLVLEKRNNQEFNRECHKYKNHAMKAIIFSSIYWPLILVLGYTGVGFTIYIGGNMVLIKAIDIATLYLFINYTTSFFDPVMAIARIMGEMQQAQASCERIIELIETPLDISDTDEVIEKYGDILNPKKEVYPPLYGDIEFKNVNFEYIAGERVLKDFNLKVKKGQSVALVGKTGSGKSTIVNLICRFYEPTTGEILIDGENYKTKSLGWLHHSLGYVLQTPHLFKGTVMENIKYGHREVTDEKAIEICKLIGADEFISKLDDGYNTNVGESGSRLSNGQKQLISFARAIIANPSILVLDEATSSIDTTTEVIIQNATNKILEGRTSFIVAHRLSTIVRCDLILVIDNGKILEQGTHQELLNKKGEYYNLYKNQFINEAIEASSK